MEKLLILGINTRAIVNSALKLDYLTFSGSYYSTLDFKVPYLEKHKLKKKSGQSCEYFETNYSHEKLLEISKEMMDKVDYIILTTSISPIDFKGEFRRYKKKIIGNQNVDNVEDKYKFYKKIKNQFLTPKTFKIKYRNISDAIEIAKQYDDKEFIIKPLQGSGGYGVKYLNYSRDNDFKAMNFGSKNHDHGDSDFRNFESQYFIQEDSDFLVQEFIPGSNISSSVLSSKNEVKTIINSKMLTEADFGIKNSFKYCGNIVPLNIDIVKKFNSENSYSSDEKRINTQHINEVAEDLIANFKLVGSNGVDMIINNDKIHIIEINPRFQGTYELVENVLKMNLLESHIKACNNEAIHVPTPKGYSMKKIIYSKEKSIIGNLAIENVYDIPYEGVIIEKNQPLATIITHENQFNETMYKLNIANKKINKKIDVVK
jgi:predicted ATP-grasp superfamily ATP-dependent carboligase